MAETAERTKPASQLDGLQVASDYGPPLATIPPSRPGPAAATALQQARERLAGNSSEPAATIPAGGSAIAQDSPPLDRAMLLTIAREHGLSFAELLRDANAVASAALAALRTAPAIRSAEHVQAVIAEREAAREALRQEREALRQER